MGKGEALSKAGLFLSALLVLRCAMHAESSTGHFRVLAANDIVDRAEKLKDHSCSIKGENLSGRGDSECDPFPCENGKCVVTSCSGEDMCHPGFCSQGYCVRAEEGGRRSCGEFSFPKGDVVDEKFDWVGKWSGCNCTPDSQGAQRDEPRCGGFPCTADGCYVHPCRVDADCAAGMCSSHASGPHGYCVTDDPY